ncbi:DUF2264 domain-containing protein [Paenibacillus macerans]|uniref:DUF2264 domain-containing protein n=1 Tax=Paenibacillus macerans TaxID=44252 RepID=UPI003D31CDC0
MTESESVHSEAACVRASDYGTPSIKTSVAKALRRNPLITRRDLQDAFLQLGGPLKGHYSEGRARLELTGAGAGHPASVAGLEGFSRVLWGMVPFLAGGGEDSLWDICLEGIRHGTDPGHAEYWGEVNDYDQRLVEMAVFGLALALIPERIWEPLTERERSRLYEWLNQINRRPCHDCNWLFFHILVNLGFRKAGLPYDAAQVERNLDRIDGFYLEDGWYSDGAGGHSDYYVPLAFHYCGLLYAKLMGDEDPERADRFKERAARFAGDFIHWFGPNGAALPYGRSLTYRFAQAAFWCALAYAEVPVLSPGIVKGVVMRHLRWWFRQPILDAGGLLTVGYTYPNLVMAENYNAPGSPYWAFKTFLPLAFPEGHPFWQAEEEPLPEAAPFSVQRPPHLVVCRQAETGHTAAFNAGHPYSNEHTHTSAKYEKFVYSTAFGFSVPRGEWGLGQGAFDSMLALSEGDNLYRVRRRNEETRIEDNVLYARWKPWRDVCVRTWLVAALPWHVRIHRIATERELDAAEGGFALGLGDPGAEAHLTLPEGGVGVSNRNGKCAVVNLLGYDRSELIYPQANTNVLHPQTVIPTLRGHLALGRHWLIAAVYGEPVRDPGGMDNELGGGGNVPLLAKSLPVTVDTFHGEIRITSCTGSVIAIKMDDAEAK